MEHASARRIRQTITRRTSQAWTHRPRCRAPRRRRTARVVARRRRAPGGHRVMSRSTDVNPRPRLLDLFCGSGGAAMGYHRAGFDVVGVDIKPQPNYPFPYETDDVFNFLDRCDVTRAFDAIHASPVCIGYANVTAWRGDPSAHPRQLAPIID